MTRRKRRGRELGALSTGSTVALVAGGVLVTGIVAWVVVAKMAAGITAGQGPYPASY